MAGSGPSLQVDPRRPTWIAAFGRKGSGKSFLASRYWESYPFDRLAIDPTGDAAVGDDIEALESPLPARWPTRVDGKRSSLRFVPDMGSPTYQDDMDRAAGLAFNKGDCLLWVDEVGELTSANHTPPHMRRILHQHRHRGLSVLVCGPRPIDISPLTISQANYLAIFDVPGVADRRRLADTMGWDRADFDAAHEQIWRPPEDSPNTWTGYLWWDAIRRSLAIMPPLPPRRRPDGQRFARARAEKRDEMAIP